MAPIDSFSPGIIRCIFPSSSPSFVAFAFVIVVVITILIAAIIFLIRDGVQLGLVSSLTCHFLSRSQYYMYVNVMVKTRAWTHHQISDMRAHRRTRSRRPGLRGFCESLCRIPQVNNGNAHKDYCQRYYGLSIKLTAASAKSNQQPWLSASRMLKNAFVPPMSFSGEITVAVFHANPPRRSTRHPSPF